MAAVNRPTDVKQKEADINQKLQLYGIYSGMSDPPFPNRASSAIHSRSSVILEFSSSWQKYTNPVR